MRKSFIIHNDSLSILDDLTVEEAGQLFRAIRAYQLGESIDLSPIVKVAFSPFKNQFNRDADKYEKLCEKNRLIAVNRYKPSDTKSTSGNQSSPSVTKSTDNDSKSDSDSKNKSDSNKYSSDDYSLSVAMYELIIKIAPHTKKPDFEKWANIIRLMREVDKIPLVTIQQVFNWANSDDFWKTNILSASKLRKQFNQLQAKMVNTNETNQRPNSQSVTERASEQARAVWAECEAEEASQRVVGENDTPLQASMGEGRGRDIN